MLVVGNEVSIILTISPPRDAVCTQVYGYFEKTVNLCSDFVSVQTYTVNVNDYTTSFVME